VINIPRQPWWETDEYIVEDTIPPQITDRAADLYGPNGVALIRAYVSGAAQDGWGLTSKKGEGFMPRYLRGEFLERKALFGYDAGKHGMAFVLRSMRLLCVDIDGKNGGLKYAPSLGNLPYTLAETSKGGNGYHLWYYVEDDWDETTGFGLLPDQVGIVQGVDIRGTGCIYHWPTQRWNTRPITPLPQFLKTRLLEHAQQRTAKAEAIKAIAASEDPEEILLLQASLLEELKKPIKAGQRNTTLFAIGGKLKAAGVDKWQAPVVERGLKIGLDSKEIDDIIRNIERYS
jgi:hypothetical protein